MTNIQPFGNRILVRPLENRPLRQRKWKVVMGGPETDINSGDIVLVEWVDDVFEHEGEKYGIVSKDAVMAIIR